MVQKKGRKKAYNSKHKLNIKSCLLTKKLTSVKTAIVAGNVVAGLNILNRTFDMIPKHPSKLDMYRKMTPLCQSVLSAYLEICRRKQNGFRYNSIYLQTSFVRSGIVAHACVA